MDSSVNLIHRISINEYGFVYVNDTIIVKNNASSPLPLGSFELLYPKSYFGNIGAMLTKGPVDFSVKVLQEQNLTKIAISPAQAYQIAVRSNVSINLQLYLNKLIRSVTGSQYRITVALQPALTVNVSKVDILFTLPPTGQSNPEDSMGFEKTVGEKEMVVIESWKATHTNVPAGNYSFRDVRFSVSSGTFALIDFIELRRELLVSPNISVKVEESLRIHHYGGQDLTKIGIRYLDSNLTSVVFLPSSIPPLSARQTVTVSGEKISLEDVFKRPLKDGENITLQFEYLLPSRSIESKDGGFALAVPLSSPVKGFIRNYNVSVNLPPGFTLVSPLTGYSRLNASIFDDGTLAVNFRPGLGWASGDVIPFASGIFIVSLGVLLLTQRGRGKEVKEAPKKIGEFIRAHEEKTTATAALLDELARKGIERVGRQEIDDTRRTLEEVRAKSASRSSELRPGLLAAKPGLERLLNEIASIDREYDRATRDLFNVLEQYYLRRMKKETFERMLPGHQKRVERLASNLAELLNSIQREFER